MKAIWLRREGDRTVVLVEHERGVWVPVISEPYDNAFSHIVEPAGIESSVEKHLAAKRAAAERVSGGGG